ncbi:MAG: prepilin-type N-terminal cleavage/methylation domain-containing protein [bacterium]|nr:prepilin-type N-terminal cleavage/methylation domain-containing protein [bacterium]MBU1916655.1 prepilin-type N-terminal cleavage/methylation domain-containing protein [bacterium]
MKNRISNNRGFSLIECALTILIVSTALIVSMSVLQDGVMANTYSEGTTVATQIANEKLEEILADKAYRGYSYVIDSANYPEEIIQGEITRSVVVTEVSDTDFNTAEEGSGLSKVDVVVKWAKDEEVVLTTLVSDYDF